jgi:hypothetical protein
LFCHLLLIIFYSLIQLLNLLLSGCQEFLEWNSGKENEKIAKNVDRNLC